MGKLVGVVGKPNSGKSTFFSAATLAHAEIAAYPFTTIKPNRGVGYVKVKCACKEFNKTCNPQNSVCENGTRLIPIEMLDVAGLVPGAHMGKGMGNQFLDDLRQADALIHIVDASGSTDSEGKQCEPGTHNPIADVKFLEEELDLWFINLLKKDWQKISKEVEQSSKNPEKVLAEKLSGLGITEKQIAKSMKESGLAVEDFARALRKNSKPIIICANKSDLKESEKFLDELKISHNAIPTSADSELALRRAAEKGLIEYVPGTNDFKIARELSDSQKKALEFIRENILKKLGNTGVQQCINKAVFKILNLIVVYPVEDENKLTDKHGNVLPHTFLVIRGTTARELAYKVHTQIGEKFIAAVDARTKKRLAADYELKDRDIIKIMISH
ncbi:TPA: redox-regulated ATPase YchF [archaeon]|uniref:Redox-regulated ATPase YchF n=1 Tax=Candidatus Naiadarchaeum limnaeum TaxID=2756139 RepID=A0A832XH06_9ARCH|nr:redox-regulated ATPase YchF [Candidatus Naiadarchaeales archaeon SRR2090153.bin1042]HIK00834.1 redox-regulated ATPase YchF [Candidatus Naiadarchaeum limnaeum]